MKFPFSNAFSQLKKQMDRHRGRQLTPGKPDRWLMVSVFLMSLFGVLMVFNSSVAIAIRDFSDPYYFAREQLKWLVIGTIGFLISSKIPYRFWYRMAVPALIGTLLLLIAVFLPGIGVHALGANRWVNFGFFVLQPAELAKLVMVLYLSAWFSKQEKSRLGAFLLLLGMVAGLVILEPDLGTTIVIVCISLWLYFFSGAPLVHFGFLVPLVMVAVIVLAVASPYRAQRIMTFMNPEHDPQGSSYQIRQVLLGLGSGGWSGVGIGKSRQKYEYLPEANTDAILAIIGEEVGFVGTAMVVFGFLFIVSRGYRIAARTKDTFGRLVALGISSWVASQACINISAMVALVPLTGVPLPFVSYGGSSMILLLFAMGIVNNISTYRNE
jgi:cell division protein FtsW